MACNPDCIECLRRRIVELEKELESARDEAEWLRDEEGRRSAELAEQHARNAHKGRALLEMYEDKTK